jgi:hypothetical protein
VIDAPPWNEPLTMVASSCAEACSAHRLPNTKPRCRSASASIVSSYPALTGPGEADRAGAFDALANRRKLGGLKDWQGAP